MILSLNKPWVQRLLHLLLWADRRLLFINGKR